MQGAGGPPRLFEAFQEAPRREQRRLHAFVHPAAAAVPGTRCALVGASGQADMAGAGTAAGTVHRCGGGRTRSSGQAMPRRPSLDEPRLDGAGSGQKVCDGADSPGGATAEECLADLGTGWADAVLAVNAENHLCHLLVGHHDGRGQAVAQPLEGIATLIGCIRHAPHRGAEVTSDCGSREAAPLIKTLEELAAQKPRGNTIA
mmetsp:Transcript_126333/g.269499  ORF Transcript_126333/g.269499 Transcript_126333/m.269499 type:complete len:203 (-) Transcript_126333:435-1043(-)